MWCRPATSDYIKFCWPCDGHIRIGRFLILKKDLSTNFLEIRNFLTLSAFGLVKSIRSFASSNHRIFGFPAFFIIFCQDQANFVWLWYDSFCYFYWLFTRFSSLQIFLEKILLFHFPCHSSFCPFCIFPEMLNSAPPFQIISKPNWIREKKTSTRVRNIFCWKKFGKNNFSRQKIFEVELL